MRGRHHLPIDPKAPPPRLTWSGLREAAGLLAYLLLFGGTVAENIAYGRPGASQAEIEEAARRANAHDFQGQGKCDRAVQQRAGRYGRASAGEHG